MAVDMVCTKVVCAFVPRLHRLLAARKLAKRLDRFWPGGEAMAHIPDGEVARLKAEMSLERLAELPGQVIDYSENRVAPRVARGCPRIPMDLAGPQ